MDSSDRTIANTNLDTHIQKNIKGKQLILSPEVLLALIILVTPKLENVCYSKSESKIEDDEN